MSYNGTGTFLINTAGQPVVTNTVISATTFNLLTADLANGLTNAITKDGQTTVTANIPMSNFKITGLGAATTANDAVRLEQLTSGATNVSFGNLAYTGTLTGGTGVINIGSGQVYKAAGGNLGIGTTDPQAKLSVSNGGAAGFEFFPNYPGGGVGTYIQSYNRSGAAYVNTAYDALSHSFRSSGSEKMLIKSSGDVEVFGGRTSLAASNETFALGVRYNSTTGSYYVGATNSATPDLVFSRAGGEERVRITDAGNVGIGTISPNQKLQVVGSNSTGFAGATLQNSNANVGLAGVQFSSDTTYSKSAIAQVRENVNGIGPLVFYVDSVTDAADWSAGDEKMRIDTSGNLLVGIASTLNDGKVTLRTPNSFTGYGFRSDSVTAADTTWGHFYGTSSSNSVANIIIYGNGNIQNANNSYGALSDSKLKENIVDATPKLEKLNQVRVVNFNLIGDTQKQLGVIAQELEQIFPGMIDETIDRDAEGKGLGTTTKSVKYSVFVPMLIKAIQEQQALIQDLTTRLNTLEGS